MIPHAELAAALAALHTLADAAELTHCAALFIEANLAQANLHEAVEFDEATQ